jgi:hypothetical protein
MFLSPTLKRCWTCFVKGEIICIYMQVYTPEALDEGLESAAASFIESEALIVESHCVS